MATEESNGLNFTKAEAIETILYQLKASTKCEEHRKRFTLCRATQVGRLGDPTFCEDKAAKYLDCYNKVKFLYPSNEESLLSKEKASFTNRKKRHCVTQYQAAFDCLYQNESKIPDWARFSPNGKCMREVDDFMLC
ncbi:unnamed protein product [Moneuplotes crassus]|uniref:Uncharacterized protein n=1 Tax=Euplotes crassus TaxID=5936 RepID=A0AAD1Y1K6_EUPCR|nr:unnamed protein product [Moneuplotes crassus]